MKTTNKALYFHYTEWIMDHPRFAFVMAILIGLSLINQPLLSVVLFVLFSIEIGHRIALMRYYTILSPYKAHVKRKTEVLFLVLDIIGALSLLITIFASSIPVEAGILARFARVFYLIRVAKIFRYIDLQSALYSPTYGMFVSLVVIVSFFAEGMYLWAILSFFMIEIIIRKFILRNMHFSNKKDKVKEWFFWFTDLIATIAMLPIFAGANAAGVLRMLRLVRLLRPWLIIVRNLTQVIREGQFMQEINLILLLLAVLSIGGGFASEFLISDYDYTRDGIINANDRTMLAHIWFAFRAFTDPGNIVHFPDSEAIAVFSVFAVIAGVFIFAFFIGIGASIVAGLMSKLRNNELNIADHMVMLGWNGASTFVIQQLRMLSNRNFSRLRLVLLHDEEKQPPGFQNEPWVTFRWGDMENKTDLKRINLSAARQAIVNVPDHQSPSENLAHSQFALMSIRSENPDILINYATPGMSTPHLKCYHHQLQMGWDKKKFYDKPTVILSEADIRANLFRQIMHYPDFDQILSRLMIPIRHDESSLQVTNWAGTVQLVGDEYIIETENGEYKAPLKQIVSNLFSRGVILLGLSDKNLKTHAAINPHETINVTRILGISLNENELLGEMEYAIRHSKDMSHLAASPNELNISPLDSGENIKIVIIGNISALPLMLKRLLNSYQTLDITIIDDLNREEHIDHLVYLRRRIGEMEGADARIATTILRWDFSNMDFLRDVVKGADRIIISRPIHVTKRPHAIVSSVLSHLTTILDQTGEKPFIFPVVDNRDQAEMLQLELDKFDVEHEAHVVVPNEFYGTYVAHTSFGMFTSEGGDSYDSQRVLRHIINDLMADVDNHDLFDMDALKVTSTLPDNIHTLFLSLLEQNCLLIGYRLNQSFERTHGIHEAIFKAFPREDNFRCLRQGKIVLNPLASAVLQETWEAQRNNIIELIIIRA